MKKGLCIILSIMMILVSFAACGDKEESKKVQAVTQVVTDANGEAVTDKDGNVVTEKVTDKDGKFVTEVVGSETKPSSTNPTSSSSSSDSGSVNSKPLDEGTKTEDTHLVDTVLKPVFKTKKFTMKVRVTSEGVSMPMTMTVDGENAAFLVSMKDMKGMDEMDEMAAYLGDDVKLIVKDGKSYTAMEMLGQKIYMETDGADLGMDMDGFMDPTGDSSLKYVKTTTVKDGNKTYTCEEYKSDDGSVTKYYFEGNKWARLEMIENGTSSVMEITEFKNTVDTKIFDLKGYTKFDTSSFGM